ncbi:hypothetical protein B0H21DRAFT_710745 [Amylocystis lapponica]|nr:hypothetical protein B0H21DRAFT_710745 [Amylocystis lapponica]
MAIDEARAAELQARLRERDEIVRESWVRAMEAKIVRDNITKCYRLEGVNHMEKCKDLVDKYKVMLRENKVIVGNDRCSIRRCCTQLPLEEFLLRAAALTACTQD